MQSRARRNEGLAPQQENHTYEQTNLRWLDLSDDWEQQPKFYGRPWQMEEII
jgi:hypothetical protein